MENKTLKKYLKKSCSSSLDTCAELLSSNEALKQFGKIGGDYKPDLMMMLTSIELEYMAKTDFSREQIQTVKYFIAEITKFFKRCKTEHDRQIEKEQTRVRP